MKIRIVILLLAMLAGISVSAQSRIDRAIDDLENKSDVETTYTERRTAKSHKLYRITIILNFQKEEYYKRLAKAFEDEREKSVSAIKTRDQRTYKFVDNKGTSTYTLYNNSVVKTWRGIEDDLDDESCVDAKWEFNPIDRTLISCNNKDIEAIVREAQDLRRRIEEDALRALE